MSTIDTKKTIDFLKFVGGLKDIERFRGQFFWKDYEQRKRYESVADHTWRMALLLLLIEQHLSRPIDLSKALKMLLMHDIAEVVTGDVSPFGSDGTGRDAHLYDKNAALKKYTNEAVAAEKIFSMLPPDQKKELHRLWDEYEKQESFESKVVKAVDKLEGKLQASEYIDGPMFKAHLDFSLKYGAGTFDIDPAIKELATAVNEEFTKNYREFKTVK